jgi:hypothetical protein
MGESNSESPRYNTTHTNEKTMGNQDRMKKRQSSKFKAHCFEDRQIDEVVLEKKVFVRLVNNTTTDHDNDEMQQYTMRMQ